jgi:adenine phosphoribosyltransferase
MSLLRDEVKESIRTIHDFPKKGIPFKDISTLLANPELMKRVVEWAAFWFDSLSDGPLLDFPDVVVGLDSRGFLFGAPAAILMEKPFVMCRKAGKLPGECESVSYDLEYGSATVELQKDAFEPGTRVMIIDDLLATGGTALASVELVRSLGGVVTECVFVTELGYLDGRKNLEAAGVTVRSLVVY